MKTADILRRLVDSKKGLTPERIAKAKLLGLRHRNHVAVMEAIAALPGVNQELIESAHRFRVKNLQDAIVAIQGGAETTDAQVLEQRKNAVAYLTQALETEHTTYAEAANA